MINTDQILLEQAYTTIGKKVVSSETENLPSNITDTTPVTEPAPNVQTGAAEVVNIEPTPELSDTIAATGNSAHSDENAEAELEEEQMVIDNLNSIRESIMKTAAYCASGGHLEPWQQQKLAIAMDNLASIARSLNSGCKC
jgi:hypothetical protein